MNELWSAIEDANQPAEPEKVRNSMIVPAANEVIDLSSTRSWANRNHLPSAVLIVLIASVLLACLLLGHSSSKPEGMSVFGWHHRQFLLSFSTWSSILIDHAVDSSRLT